MLLEPKIETKLYANSLYDHIAVPQEAPKVILQKEAIYTTIPEYIKGWPSFEGN